MYNIELKIKYSTNTYQNVWTLTLYYIMKQQAVIKINEWDVWSSISFVESKCVDHVGSHFFIFAWQHVKDVAVGLTTLPKPLSFTLLVFLITLNSNVLKNTKNHLLFLTLFAILEFILLCSAYLICLLMQNEFAWSLDMGY